MAGAISSYYWLILQEDRRGTSALKQTPAEQVQVSKDLIAMAPDTAQDLLQSLGLLLEVPISVWRRLDSDDAPSLTGEELAAVRLEIINAPGNRALLIVDGFGI